eukprot:GHUV01007842.1.p1 GENE.GHUV01007842.1~~GHUV01007842.1.p1  ORF type:complete len:374 (+),score=60.39 GHUV01007842.1:57-1124(+)
MAAMVAHQPCTARSFGLLSRAKSTWNVHVARPCPHNSLSPKRLPQVAVASSVAVQPSQGCSNSFGPLQRLCKSVLVGVAGAALWSVLASVVTGPSAPFASLTIAATSPGASSATAAAKSAWAGLAAGFLHTLCGPDHLAALTPLTIGRNRAAASALGALWGFGHSTGQLILGLVFVILKDRFHDFVPALSRWSGTVVGMTLIAIGLMGVYETYFEGPQAEEHEEHELKLAVAGADGSITAAAASSGTFQQQAKVGLATYATGIVYGLHPDALFVVIPALALPTKLAAVAYCTMFVLGTVAAMGGYTAVIGTTSAALTKERPWLQAHLSTIASGIAIVVGVLILLSGFGLQVPMFG